MSQESEHSLALGPPDQGLARQGLSSHPGDLIGEESASKLMQNDGKVNFLTVISLEIPLLTPS